MPMKAISPTWKFAEEQKMRASPPNMPYPDATEPPAPRNPPARPPNSPPRRIHDCRRTGRRRSGQAQVACWAGRWCAGERRCRRRRRRGRRCGEAAAAAAARAEAAADAGVSGGCQHGERRGHRQRPRSVLVIQSGTFGPPRRPPPNLERLGLCLKSYAILGCDGA